MALFSERFGYVKPRDMIQIDSMDAALKNGLWNVLYLHLWGNPRLDLRIDSGRMSGPTRTAVLSRTIWMDFFKIPVASAPELAAKLNIAMNSWYQQAEWERIFDLVEFLLASRIVNRDEVQKDLNVILERERSGYRLADGQFVRITDENELAAVEDASNGPFGPAAQHIQQAVRLYADRKAPDYRNVVKEAISAVESVARTLTGKDDLAPALAELEKKHQLHAVLKQGFIKLYSYTNGEDGIRHAMLDDKVEVTEADARYMLVTCSAFVNYLVSRFGG